MPRVSVIMATHNQASFIQESLNSIFQQGFRDYEIIVVNDGSTDDTEDVLEPYRDRIRYFKQPNSGPAAAHNLGLRHSLGELIAFLNSDDLWMPGKLEAQVGYMDEHPEVGLVHGDYVRIDARGRAMGPSIHTEHPPSLTLEQIVRHNTIGIATVIVRRKWLDRVSGLDPDSTPTEDLDLWIRLAQAGCPFGYLPQVIGKWRRHPASISKSRSRVLKAHIRILRGLERTETSDPQGADIAGMVRRKILKEERALWAEDRREGKNSEAGKLALQIFREEPLDPRSWIILAGCLMPAHIATSLGSLRQRLRRSEG